MLMVWAAVVTVVKHINFVIYHRKKKRIKIDMQNNTFPTFWFILPNLSDYKSQMPKNAYKEKKS